MRELVQGTFSIKANLQRLIYNFKPYKPNMTDKTLNIFRIEETSLLRRQQVQTFTDASPPTGKIHLYSKIAVTSNQRCNFDFLGNLESPYLFKLVYFMVGSHRQLQEGATAL